jgi:hypothetical protein
VAGGESPVQEWREQAITWVLAFAQLASWGSVYYSFSLLFVPLEQTMEPDCDGRSLLSWPARVMVRGPPCRAMD